MLIPLCRMLQRIFVLIMCPGDFSCVLVIFAAERWLLGFYEACGRRAHLGRFLLLMLLMLLLLLLTLLPLRLPLSTRTFASATASAASFFLRARCLLRMSELGVTKPWHRLNRRCDGLLYIIGLTRP